MKPEFSKEEIEKVEQKEKGVGFDALNRREKYMLSGVSPSTQRRYEKEGLEEGILIKDSQGKLHLNHEKYDQLVAELT